MDIEEQYDKIYRFCYYKVHSKETAEKALRLLRAEGEARTLVAGSQHFQEFWSFRGSYFYTFFQLFPFCSSLHRKGYAINLLSL